MQLINPTPRNGRGGRIATASTPLAAALLLASCAGDPLHADDYRELFAHARSEIELGPGRRDPLPRPFRHAIELSATAVDGLNATDDLSTQLERYRLVEVAAAWKPTLRVGDNLSLSGLAGLGYDDYEIDATATLAGTSVTTAGGTLTRRAADGRAMGALIGAEARVGFGVFGLYGRASRTTLLLGASEMAELGITLQLHSSLTLQAAYRWWNLDLEELAFISEVSLDIEGITVGGVVRF